VIPSLKGFINLFFNRGHLSVWHKILTSPLLTLLALRAESTALLPPPITTTLDPTEEPTFKFNENKREIQSTNTVQIFAGNFQSIVLVTPIAIKKALYPRSRRS
jgi:hypothetical protein